MMRTAFLIFLAGSAPFLQAAPSSIGLLPQDKKPLLVDADEPNPFGNRVKKASAEAVVLTESEETRIRGIITNLPLGGLTRGYGVTKVLLGSHMIEAGKFLPDMIPAQTEKVKVLSVSDERVELGFVEKNGQVGERTMMLAIDLQPVVRFKMRGNAPAKTSEGAAQFDGVTKGHESGPSRN